MKILAFTGGGVRGLLSARLAERLEKKSRGWACGADLVAGTSVGAINAAAVAAGVPWRQVTWLFRHNMRRVFTPPDGDVWAWLDDPRGAQYKTEGLAEVLEEVFGKKRLGDLPGPMLFVPALDVDVDGGPVFYTTESHPHELLVDVLLRTTAAPTFFPAYQGFLDGGLVANDPTVCAMAEALGRHERGTLGFLELLQGLTVFTMGTGQTKRTPTRASSGLEWARDIVEGVIQGGLAGPLRQAAAFLGTRHFHLSPQLGREIALDGHAWSGSPALERALLELEGVADETNLEPALAWLETYWR